MIDISQIIGNRLISLDIAGGNVIIVDQPMESDIPAVTISESSTTGNTWEGLYETTVTVNCVSYSDYDAQQLASQVRDALDGWGGDGLEDIIHTSTIPIRNYDTAPAIHTRAVSFRVLHMEVI